MNKKLIIISGVVVLLLALVSAAFLFSRSTVNTAKAVEVSNYEECINAGYTFIDTYPQECVTPDGITHIRRLNKDEVVDLPGSTVNEGDDGEVACTMDAFLCPDGSYVGRIPPTCEFAPCDSVPTE